MIAGAGAGAGAGADAGAGPPAWVCAATRMPPVLDRLGDGTVPR
jgi:hypothetical protein